MCSEKFCGQLLGEERVHNANRIEDLPMIHIFRIENRASSSLGGIHNQGIPERDLCFTSISKAAIVVLRDVSDHLPSQVVTHALGRVRNRKSGCLNLRRRLKQNS